MMALLSVTDDGVVIMVCDFCDCVIECNDGDDGVIECDRGQYD